MIQRYQVYDIVVCHPFYFRQTGKDHIGRKLKNKKSDHAFFFKQPGCQDPRQLAKQWWGLELVANIL